MKLYPNKLKSSLKQLLPIYVVSGDDPFLCQEACDLIRATAKQQGHDEREIFYADRNFDWGQFYQASASLSLFAQKKVIELRLSSSKLTDQGVKTLIEYAQQPAPDTLLLISLPKLDGSTLKSKWAKALLDSPDCGFMQIYPVDSKELPQWIMQRLTEQGLSADAQAIDLIVTRVEGNLLAAVQEIEKLKLLSNKSHLDIDTVQACIADSARYDVFTLVDAALNGEAQRSLKILAGLRAEGMDTPIILWALSRDIRQLAQLSNSYSQGIPTDKLLTKIWPQARKPLFAKALSRHSSEQWQRMLSLAQLIDEQGKGQAIGDPWISLNSLVLELCALPLFRHSTY
ncbi:DNA polymerase III subunit delta [Pseudomonas sp. F1_0610]|uniref:DNA polymerase III subunit delta n=1 Tax=Pseudomonas sp. F1_0610 TaxID=3114284 RepID=UPI0039C005A7